jgi:hypothetical protein
MSSSLTLNFSIAALLLGGPGANFGRTENPAWRQVGVMAPAGQISKDSKPSASPSFVTLCIGRMNVKSEGHRRSLLMQIAIEFAEEIRRHSISVSAAPEQLDRSRESKIARTLRLPRSSVPVAQWNLAVCGTESFVSAAGEEQRR